MRKEHTGECKHIRETLDRIGDKWSLQVIGALVDGPRIYAELQRNIGGISQRMLTLTVRHLERDGLIRRVPLQTVPISVQYALTPLGVSFSVPVRALTDWTRRHHQELSGARALYDEIQRAKPARATGAPTSVK